MRKKPLLLLAVAIAVVACVSAVSPVLREHDDKLPDVLSDHLFHERSKSFPTADAAPEDGDGEHIFVLPEWVPDDAKDVREKVRTDGNAKLIGFTVTGEPPELNGPECAGGAFNEAPVLDAPWWPDGVGESDGKPVCSGEYQFRALVEGRHVYAWTNGQRTDE